MGTTYKLSAVNGIIKIILKRPMTYCGILSGHFYPMVVAVMAGGYIVGELAFHSGQHAVSTFISAACCIVYKYKVIGKTCTKPVPVFFIKAIPIICLELLYSANIFLYLYSPFKFFQSDHKIHLLKQQLTSYPSRQQHRCTHR